MPEHEDPPRQFRHVADRIRAARRFVGRQAELELVAAALAAGTPAFAVLYVYGPGGIGKTSLLQQYARMASTAGRRVALLDSRNLDPSPQGFLLGLAAALGTDDVDATLAVLAHEPDPVLLIDTYENLTPLDTWLREVFLPRLPARALVVIAGRLPPTPGWRTDAAWRDLVRVVALRNLRPEESQIYLAQRGLPPAQHAAVLGFTHGHPLALSLIADVAAQGGAVTFDPMQAPDVVALLLDRFVQDVPSPLHRLALHACASARMTTEPLLRAALELPDVQTLFAWLRSLSFIEQGPLGLFPHDLVRELLDSDLRWRDPERYTLLHQRLRDAIAQRILESQGVEQVRAVYDLVYLHRHNPILQPYFQWQSFGTLYAEPVRPDEHTALLAWVTTCSGASETTLAAHWLQQQPQAWQIIRDAGGRIAGLFMYLALDLTSPEDRASDPAVASAWAYAQQRGPLRPGDEVTLARYYVDPATALHPNPVMNTAQVVTAMRWMTSPRLAWSFCDLFAPEHWHAMMSYYDFHRVPEPRFGLYAHDWRQTPVRDWITRVGSRELATDLRIADLAVAAQAPLLALSQPEFEAAVRTALRDLHRLEALAASPLLRSRVARDHANGQPSAASLQRLLCLGIATLLDRPKDAKFARALEATFVQPATTQELAAERLGLPFTTYRYQLTQGAERLATWLWQREIYGAED
ncbi:AAA family ATPase [Roseiflexus sp.]